MGVTSEQMKRVWALRSSEQRAAVGDSISSAKTGQQGTVEERFLVKTKRTGKCLEWIGARDGNGYGLFRPYGRRGALIRAHIFALKKKLKRELKIGFKALHTCDNPPCVEPAHLFEGTSADNAEDRNAKGRHAYGERNGRAVLTKSQVVSAREEYANGVSVEVLAKKYGLTYHGMRAVVKRVNWKHVL